MRKKKSTNVVDTPPIDRAQKLRDLAGKRVPKAVKAIQLVGNLANYKPTEDQAAAIVAALKEEVSRVQSRFQGDISTALAFQLP